MPQWIAVAVAITGLILSLYAIVSGWGEDKGGTKEWRKMVDDKLTNHANHHADHYEHARDTEVHWTTRERDTLQRTVDDVAKDVKELLKAKSAKA